MTTDHSRHVVYLHGFASSPASGKAQRFRQECEARGWSFACPDLNLPAFETLTITRMLDQTRDVIDATGEGPVLLVGSSLGGFVAAHAAARDTTGRVARLALMAPAFDFGGNRLRQLGPAGVDEWRRDGSIEFFHYADNRPRRVWFRLYEDAAQYDAFALRLTQPVHIFQGRRDDTVLPETVAAWASGRPNVDLHWYDDGHQLAESVEDILSVSISRFAS
ncbi:MAG: alpha/beta fold hydrolase [Acidobacteria bacterium]|nr:MAG: alpha/beta fold hydrolase [Acidobacteriota bacterium]